MSFVKMEEVNNIPALFLFGDSMADTGNNNRLFTLARADFSPYGQNFVDSVPTGRFTDGFLPVDYLGLSEAQTACCGWGEYRGGTPCMPLIKSVCTNASQHLFWDYVHPTSAAYHVFVQHLWVGSDDVISPLNLKQLSLV